MKINWQGILSRVKTSLLGKGRTVVTDSLSIFSFDLLVFFFGFINSILLARFFGPEGRGIISILTLIPIMLFTFSDLGLSLSATIFPARKPDQARQYLFTLYLLSTLFSALLVLTAFLSFEYWYRFYQSYPAQLFFLALPASSWLLLLAVSRFFFLGMKQIFFFNLINLLQATGNLFITLVVGLFLKNSLSWYFILFLSNLVLIQTLVLFFLRKSISGTAKSHSLFLAEILKYGIRIYPASVLAVLRLRIDQLILGYLLAPELIGIYSIAVFLTENIFRLPAAVQEALFPQVSSAQGPDKYLLVAKTLKITSIIIVALAVIMIIIGYPLIWVLYGKAFLPAYPALIILVMGIIMDSIWKVVGILFVAGGRPGLVSILAFISTAINCLLSFSLIPLFGISGAALARFLSSLAISGAGLMFFHKESNLRWKEIIIPDREDYLLIKNKIWSWIK